MSEPTTNAQMIDVMNTTIGVMQDNQAQTVAAVAALYGHNTDENAHGINEDGSAFNEAINDVVDNVVEEDMSSFNEAIARGQLGDNIPSATYDLNNVVHNGQYFACNDSTNTPVSGEDGLFLVHHSPSPTGNITVQSFYTRNNVMPYIRYNFTGSWTAWEQFVDKTQLDTKADILTVNQQLDAKANISDGIPTGVIVMWSGATTAIPAGWALCNGSNGTPDLRNRFVIGAGSTYAVGATGGSTTTTISGKVGATTLSVSQMPSHYHGITGPFANSYIGVGELVTGDIDESGGSAPSTTNKTASAGSSASHTHSFSGTGSTNLPPYYALAYIMKL